MTCKNQDTAQNRKPDHSSEPHPSPAVSRLDSGEDAGFEGSRRNVAPKRVLHEPAEPFPSLELGSALGTMLDVAKELMIGLDEELVAQVGVHHFANRLTVASHRFHPSA